MSKPWFTAADHAATEVPRGAVPVGNVDLLPVLEQGAVRLLRQWCQDEAGRIALAQDFTRTLGEARGAAAVTALGHLVALFASHGRRPLMRHSLTCTCLGGDESAFAQMVAAAAAGDTEDAMAFALTMMPPDAAFAAVQTAGPLGHDILAMARRLGHDPFRDMHLRPQ
jgi:hypothetical protein